ncbi:D-2-hydroxyacid dehydrogenase [Shewanella sp. NIFS-20-20]|uniref:D-2-hydroxyacid dehydrogenase n=1 Tax=Shewanella sp. NIFS-20-20 TaxID=2853806 RepID=UPI001C480B40|nr:D-2-hydroxyacid dehydrogenase [Shewanella sp. NIFS-20-20]MBV7314440.1 D-2-hydroxyacid dehydrogenase [Shewanella sp. NIFS-20-20]
MNIIVLDGFTLNPGDLSWQPLAALGALRVYDRTAVGEIPARCHDADIVLTNKTPLDAKTLAALPRLRYIGVLATGTNVVDIKAALKLGMVVTNVPNYGSDAVAQMVLAHLLHHSNRLSVHDAAVKAGQWQAQADFCFSLTPLISLNALTLGLIGFGAIGQQVAQVALALGMRVAVHSRTRPESLPAGVVWLDLNDLLASSDVVSLHCPLTPETHELINAERLALMKPLALLINTARGSLLDEAAVAAAANTGRLFVGVDVLSSEPPSADNPLLHASNVTISPHIAWATQQARQRLLDIAVNNLIAFTQGTRLNQVLG